MSAGLESALNRHGVSLKQAMLDAAKPYLMRILGPNCVGLLVPGIGLNASCAHIGALSGQIAFVSQSGGLVTGVLDWAKTRGIGFSKFVSLGDSADVDFCDVLDFLASDPDTKSILLYVENIRHARKFMSAARAAARSKPVLIVKSGRAAESARVVAGAMAGSDDVYDAAIQRAGMLRVLTTEDLFSAVQTLARARTLHGERLAILTNAGGPGVMATDALIGSHGKLARLSESTLSKLNTILPETWSHNNPIDIIGDAPAEHYAQVMQVLSQDPQIDAILFIHAPNAIVASADIANAIAPVAHSASRNILGCWLGGESVAQARRISSEAGIPDYDTPEEAVQGFIQIAQYRRNQNLLMQVPPSIPDNFIPDRKKARELVNEILSSGRRMLSEPQAKTLLATYGIPVVQTCVAKTIDGAVLCARDIGYPVAIKILSPQITHKSDVGGVVLDLETPEAVHSAAESMTKRLEKSFPHADLQGYSVQAMARRAHAQELMVGVATDPVFGPVILFGQGGTAVEVLRDRAIGLPPLNAVLAADMVSRTRVAGLLAGYSNSPAVNMEAIYRTLIQISHLIIDIPEIVELDINPLLADDSGVIALDARIKLKAIDATVGMIDRLAIRPYPEELEEDIEWHGKHMRLRPIKPEDGPAHVAFFNALAPEDVRYRLFSNLREMQPAQLARMTQIDYDREMAFIATRNNAIGEPETLGVARVIADPDNEKAEFAIVVRSDMKGLGLGIILMNKLITYCRHRGTREIIGETLSHNSRLLNLVTKLGFDISQKSEDDTFGLRLDLAPQSVSQSQSHKTSACI